MKGEATKHTFLNLLRDLDPTEAVKNSFKDFHVEGIHYICLARSPSLTAKLYIFRPGEWEPSGPGDRVFNPHNHACNFSTWVVKGSVSNVLFEKSWFDGGREYHEFEYSTTLNGEQLLKLNDSKNLRYDTGKFLGEWESCHLNHDQVHSIIVPEDTYTALFLLQHADQPKPSTKLYMPTPKPPDLSGLYGRYTTDEIRQLVDELRWKLLED